MNDQTAPNDPHSDLPAIPPRAPTEEERAALSEWKLLIETATQEVSESATKWREGLLALVTTASSGLLVIRSTELSTLQGVMFWIVLIAWSTASVAGMIGVWYSLSASAGTPIEIDYSTFARDYGSVEGFRIEQSLHIARTLRTAQPHSHPDRSILAPPVTQCRRTKTLDRNHDGELLRIGGIGGPR